MLLDGVEKELLSRADEPEFPISSLGSLNRKLWGLKPGLTIIGARTSMGKSALALQIAVDLAMQRKRVLFLSLEMTVESMGERIFSNQEEVDNYSLIIGKLKSDSVMARKWMSFKEKLKDIPLIMTCGIGMDFSEIAEVIEHLEQNPEVIIVDYVQAIKGSRNDREALNEYIRHFRGLCIKNRIVGILCSQSNRQTFDDDDKRPTLANLKGTGFLEEHADCVMLLHWPHFYDSSKAENEYIIDIAKQRNGRTGEVKVHYKPSFYRFYDIEDKQPDFPDREEIDDIS